MRGPPQAASFDERRFPACIVALRCGTGPLSLRERVGVRGPPQAASFYERRFTAGIVCSSDAVLAPSPCGRGGWGGGPRRRLPAQQNRMKCSGAASRPFHHPRVGPPRDRDRTHRKLGGRFFGALTRWNSGGRGRRPSGLSTKNEHRRGGQYRWRSHGVVSLQYLLAPRRSGHGVFWILSGFSRRGTIQNENSADSRQSL